MKSINNIMSQMNAETEKKKKEKTERDQVKKALDYLRKNDSNNPTLKSYENRLRSLTGASQKSATGSIELYDHYKDNYSAPKTKSVKDLDGTVKSKGYDKEIKKRAEDSSPKMTIHEKKQSELKKKFGIVTNEDITYAQAQKMAREQKAKKEKVEKEKKTKETKKKDNAYIRAHKWVDDKVFEPVENLVGRFATNMADSVLLNQVKKNQPEDAPEFLKNWSDKPTTKKEKAADIAGQLGGLIAPVGASYKVTAPVAKGAYNAITRGKNFGKAGKYLNEAVKGGTAAFGYSATKEGLDEILHPQDATFEERAKRVAMESALGAVGDPAARLAGAGIKAGYSAGLKKLIPGELPKFNGQVSNETIQKLVPELPKRPNSLANDPSLNFNKPKQNNMPMNQTEAPKTTVNTPIEAAPIEPRKQTPIDTSPIDNEIANVTRKLDEIRNRPKPERVTKTQIDDQIRSLDINQGHLSASRRNGKISDEEYRRKSQENAAKRQQLLEQDKQFKSNVPDELKPMWKDEAKGFVLGDYNTRKVYGGGFYVQKSGQNLQKFRTEDEAKRFMRQQVANEKGIFHIEDVDGVLSWNSTHNEASNSWDIKAGDYSIESVDKNIWIVKHKDKAIGRYKNEKKAREEAQRHYDSTAPVSSKPNDGSINLEQQPEMALPRTVEEQRIPTPNELEQNPSFVADPLIPKESQAPNQIEIPLVKSNERRFYGNAGSKEKTSPELLKLIEDTDKSYTPMSNKKTVDFANAFISNDIEKAYQFVKNADKFDPRHITVGHRLIDEFQARGEFDRALDVVERLAEQGTKAGQSVQAYSIYGRLTAQGQLLRAQRIVNRINQNIVFEKNKVKLDEKSIQDITHAADSMQRLTGQEDVAKNVMNIMDSLKKGVAATDDDLEVISAFVEDAKKFIGDTTPKKKRTKIRPVTDVRTRDKVVDFMNKQEEAAKERLKAKIKRVNSLPVDIFYDLTVIGAAKIAKGSVKFADFAEEMVSEFGEEFRPYMKQIWDKSAESYNKQSESISNKRLNEVEKIVNKATKDKTLSAEEADSVQQYLKEYLQLTGDAKLEASMQLQSTLQLLERPTFGQKISTAQTIAQLLNPKTIVRNALGNELFYRVEQINKMVATPVDIAKSKIFGTERTVTFRSHNQGQYWHNWMLGLKSGWRGVNPMGLQTMYDLGPQAFRSKHNPMTYLEKSLGAVLRSFDHAGYMRAYNKTLGEIATLKVMNEGLTGEAKKEAIARYIREADENMKNIADQYSKYATFQDNTKLSSILQKTKENANRVSTLGLTKEFGLGDLILKYPKTPGNLIMRALEYSPAGFVRSGHLVRKAMLTKNPFDQRETVLAFTRAITGTFGFSMMGYVLADKGILTSAGHSDYEVAALERQAGKQANSVNVSALQRFIASGFNLKAAEVREGDTFVSYDWAQPVSLAIALGTGVNQSFNEKQNPSVFDAGKSAFDSATGTIVNMSVLSGLSDFLSTYQGQGYSDKFEAVGKGALSSFVPTFSNQLRQLSDNTTRNTYSPDVLQETLNKAQNRVPGIEKSLPPSFDTLGKQREVYQGGTNNILNVFLNPSFVSKYKPSKEAKFVLDYINQTGDKTVAPRIAQKKLDGIELTGAQHSKYQRIMGEEVQKGLENLVPKAQGSTNFEKIKKSLDGILRKAGEKARTEMRKELETKK
jgi:hypothetical protein